MIIMEAHFIRVLFIVMLMLSHFDLHPLPSLLILGPDAVYSSKNNTPTFINIDVPSYNLG